MCIAHIGQNNHNYGKQMSEKTKEKQTQSHIGLLSGEKNPKNKYIFTLSDGRDYWKDLTMRERFNICRKFGREKTNIVTFIWGDSLKGLTITRILK